MLGTGVFVDDYDEDLFRFFTWHLSSSIALLYVNSLEYIYLHYILYNKVLNISVHGLITWIIS